MKAQPDISSNVAGVRSPNPFWLASGPPTNSAYQVRRAFEAGWGGAVWKTLGHEPIVNVSSRYGAVDYDGRKVMGFNNIELITDRTLEDNLAEISDVKAAFPDHAVIVSLMAETNRESWHDLVKRTEDTGCDGIELNFGCPHGMSERGMGSAVGQVPKYTRQVTEWVKEIARTPVFVKLTPNVTDITHVGRAARQGGADALSLINTVNSIIGVDLETFEPLPSVAGRGSHGGYCGPAVKPIALHMVQQVFSDPEIALPVSGIGGIQAWQDAVEFMLLGAGSVQVCTAVMHYGFRIVEHLTSGLQNWMREKGFERVEEFVGHSANKIGEWADLDLGYKIVAEIDPRKCINCGLCYIACEDGAHQSIDVTQVPVHSFDSGGDGSPHRTFKSGRQQVVPGSGAGYVNVYEINQETCVGCNLCSLVCPVDGCIAMVQRPSDIPSMTWREYQERLARGEVEKIEPPDHI